MHPKWYLNHMKSSKKFDADTFFQEFGEAEFTESYNDWVEHVKRIDC